MSKVIDLTGQKFGRLTVISRAESKNKRARWNCLCECGNKTIVYGQHLKKGSTSSCGCFARQQSANRLKDKVIDLTAKKFGRLTVVSRTENKGPYVYWKCLCDCGKATVVAGSRLRSGKTKSCGCLQKTHNFKNGLSRTRLYRIYNCMKNRCYDPNHDNYKHYGGRGIKVCDEWLDKENGFIKFYNWAMANGYADNLSIDKIDNDKGYSPDNCRWATVEQQTNNRRSSKPFEWNGVTYASCAEASRQLGVPRYTLRKIKSRLSAKNI